MAHSQVRFIRERGNRVAVRLFVPDNNTLFTSLDTLANRHVREYGRGKYSKLYYYGFHNVGVNKGANEYDAMFGFRRIRR